MKWMNMNIYLKIYLWNEYIDNDKLDLENGPKSPGTNDGPFPQFWFIDKPQTRHVGACGCGV